MMPALTMLTGALLVALGIWGYVRSGQGTAMIPTYVGAIFIFLGAMAFHPAARKHIMHVVAALSLVGTGIAIWRLTMSLLAGETIQNDLKPQALLGMTLLCGALLGLCVNSFVQARLARKRAQEPARVG